MTRGKTTLSRRALLAGIAVSGIAASPAFGQRLETSLRPRPRPQGAAASVAATAPSAAAQSGATGAASEALVANARLGGQVGYALIDARSGAVLESRQSGAALPPASVAKAVTALFALERLGAGHRFVTRILATGPITNGSLSGDLVLAGGGDPTLSTDQLGELAARLKALGLRDISGRFLVWGGALPRMPLIDPTQPEHVGYNPAISGLNLNFNRVHFEWRRSQGRWQVAVDARGERFVPRVAFAQVRIADRQAPVFTYERRGQQEFWTVAASALGNGGSRWLPVRVPELYAGEVFQTLCAAQGIRLPSPQLGTLAPQGESLAAVQSDDLPTMLRAMLRHSTNITAEAIGLSASGAPSLEASGRRMSDWLGQRFGVQARFADHSGLGVQSRIAPEAMAQALLRAGPQGPLRGLMRPFNTQAAITGRGNAQGGLQVSAKTGTLNFVSCLGGYVAGRGGREMAFAIFAADTARRDALRGAERERPQGGAEWTRRARAMQGGLLETWARAYA